MRLRSWKQHAAYTRPSQHTNTVASCYALSFEHMCPSLVLCGRNCANKMVCSRSVTRRAGTRPSRVDATNLFELKEHPLLSSSTVSVELLQEDYGEGGNESSDLLTSKKELCLLFVTVTTAGMDPNASPRLMGGNGARVDGSNPKIPPSVLYGLKFHGHSSKSGNAATQPLLRLKISAIVGGNNVGPILSNSFLVTSSQSDSPKSFCDRLEDGMAAKCIKGVGSTSEWAKSTVGQLREFVSGGGKLRDPRCHVIAAKHLSYWPPPAPPPLLLNDMVEIGGALDNQALRWLGGAGELHDLIS